jgi:hypothetical protein
VWSYFSTLGRPVPVATLVIANGRDVSFSAQLSEVAWHSGPARQFILKAVATAKQSEEKPAPPPPPIIAAPAEAPAIPAAKDVIPLPESVQNTQPVADDELRAILDTATDGIITLDRKARLHLQRRGGRIFGHRIAEADNPLAILAPESESAARLSSACRGRDLPACPTTGVK